MLQIIDTRREHIKLQLSYKTAHTTNGHHHSNGSDDDDVPTTDDKPVDYTLYPEYSLTYFLYFLSKSPAFILYDDIEMLHTMTDYILFLLDALLLRCDTTVGLFYKGLLRSIKSAEDATISPDKEEKAERKDSIKKLHVLVDLTYVILSQRASSLMICRASSNVPLPDTYFKKIRYSHFSYLPKDFQIKLKPMISTTVSDTPVANKRTNVVNPDTHNISTASSITIITTPAKTVRRKRVSEDNEDDNNNHKEENSTKKRRISVKEKPQMNDDIDEEENSTKKRRISVKEKPQTDDNIEEDDRSSKKSFVININKLFH
jgi:hypothetical protein